MVCIMAAIDNKLTKCPEDDPHRCQATFALGQCQFRAVEGDVYCSTHLAIKADNKIVKEVRNYRLGKWQSRINEFADNEKVKSLREEIGIARIMLEEIINRCQDSSDLVLFQPRIAELIAKIEKLVISCHRLEEKTGMLMDKSGALHLAGSIVEIVSKYVTNPEDMEKIGNQIAEVICGIRMSESNDNV